MIFKQNFTEPEVAVYIAVTKYSILTLLLDAGREASDCARYSTTSTICAFVETHCESTMDRRTEFTGIKQCMLMHDNRS